VPSADVSNELRTYPQDSLSSPLDRREANFMLIPGNGSSTGNAVGQAAESVSTGNVDGSISSRVTSLISVDRLSATIIAISMLAALLWGAAHALTPGHGKAVVAAYLIGARGTIRHAGILGLTVTLTHTAGVFALGGVTLYLSRYILPEDLYPWLSVVSGLLVVAIGISLLYRRLRGALMPDIAEDQHTHTGHPGAGVAHPHGVHERPYGDHQHSHVGKHSGHTHFHGGHVHSHSHDGHIHSHLPPGADGSKVTWRSLLALGVSGGLVPCPAALVLLLSAISLGRLGFGMVLVVAFSVGLALVLFGIGVLMICAKRLFEHFSFEARVPRFLPVASALAISLIGLLIVLEALRQAGTV
jgi:nickel/cobalt exporter